LAINLGSEQKQNYRLRNDLYCVGWGVKLYSIHSIRATKPN